MVAGSKLLKLASVGAGVGSVGGGAAAGGQGRDLHLNFSQVLGRAGRREARTRPELGAALPPPRERGSSPARHHTTTLNITPPGQAGDIVRWVVVLEISARGKNQF